MIFLPTLSLELGGLGVDKLQDQNKIAVALNAVNAVCCSSGTLKKKEERNVDVCAVQSFFF